MYSINTFWSANNMIAERKLQEAMNEEIQHTWKSRRYRSLWYYFFEKEIQTDVRKKLESHFMSSHHLLIDPEYQACIAKSALWKSPTWWIVWDDVTFIINNYLFGQDIFSYSLKKNDTLLTETLLWILQQQNNPWFLNDSPHWMSDVVLQCRRTRADILLVQSICNGEHTYKSLLKTCGEYIGQYAVLPELFSYLGISRSTDSLLLLLEESTHNKLKDLLQPSYEIVCHLLAPDEVKAYGYVSIIDTPYTTWIGRLWYRWAHTPWYVKIIISLSIVVLSSFLWWVSLIILPLVWWLFALARSSSQYLELLKNLLIQRYTQYSEYNDKYVSLYDTMIDPDQSPKTSIAAQKTMTQRYDVVPFSGHELVWDATAYAKTLYDTIIESLSSGLAWYTKDTAMISAVYQRWKDNNLSLMIVQDGQYTEQVSYRFESLLWIVESLTWSLSSESQYSETYDIIDDLVSTKKYNFWFWTFRNALIDGVMVACSSGILWWMWSYLRNRSVTGSSAFAAGPGMITHTVTQSDPQVLFDTELLSAMKSVMKPEDVTRFVDTIMHHGQSSTLWDTMVNLFGEHQWNIYTNHLMDQRWRVEHISWESSLFSAALDHGLPTSSADIWWTKMLHFLHRVYGYDNLQDYENFINKPWLSETLRGLKDGSLSLEEFAQLDIKQREIITQAMFYTLPKEDLSWLFVQVQAEQTIDMTQSLSLGQKILDLLGWKSSSIVTWSVHTWAVIDSWSVLTGNSVISWNTDSLSWWQKTLDLLWWKSSVSTGTLQPWTVIDSGDIVSSGSTVSSSTGCRWQQYTGSTSPMTWSVDTSAVSSWWMDHLSSRWYNLTHPTYTITDTGTIDLPETPVDTQSWSLLSWDIVWTWSSSTGQTWWFEKFFTRLKGTAPSKPGSVDLSGLVNTGKIDQVLSGISPDDIQTQATGFSEQLAHQWWPLHISQFTLPIVKKSKVIK